MKKALKWTGIAVLTPPLLFLLLAALLYVPPVQNWAAQRVAAVASAKTGMDISVGRVSLEWPLNLGIEHFRAVRQNDSLPQLKDTIADIGKLVADIQLRPLFSKRVVVNELALQQAKVNTDGLLSDLCVKGRMEELWLASKGIDLDRETVEVNGARLTGASLDIALSDTAAVDTTQQSAKWRIDADSLTLSSTALKLHLPGDTLGVGLYFGQAVGREACIDLSADVYRVASLDWHDGAVSYDNLRAPATAGLDYNHIGLTDIRLKADTIQFSPQGLALNFRQCALSEKCGIEISELSGALRLDSAYNNIQMPEMRLRTPDSDIYAEVDMDFNSFGDHDPGQTRLRLNAQLGKQDLMKLLGDAPQDFARLYPNHPLSIKGSVGGNVRQMQFTGLDINLPTALHASIDGTAGNLTTPEQLKADLRLKATAQNLNFLLAMADPALARDYRIPGGMTLDGTLKADGPRYSADLTATEGNGRLTLRAEAGIPLTTKADGTTQANLDDASYDADISVSNLNLHHFMPNDSLYTLSTDIKAKGHGTNLLASHSRLNADATIHQLHYGHWNLTGLTAKANLHDGRGQAALTGRNELFYGTIGIDALLNTRHFDGTVSADIAKADLLRLRLVSDTLTIGLCGHIDVSSDMKQTHYVSGILSDLSIRDEKHTYRPGDVGLLLDTNPDTTRLRAQSGDFIVKLDASGGYERLASQFGRLSDSIRAQYDRRIIDQGAIKQLLPNLKLHVESKRNNPVADLLKTGDITFGELFADLSTSPETGINGKSYLYSLNYDSIRLDTIRLNLTQKGERLTYQGQVCNNRRNPQFVFNTLLDGHIHQHGALAGLRYYDDRNRLGVRIGATAEMESEGIRFRLMPERPTIGYKEFQLNEDNYIFLGRQNKIQAKVDLIADDKTGIKLYTAQQDSTMLQDLTVSINRLDLGELTSVVPYLPHITGHLQGDYHIMQDRQENISVASDMAVQNMTYEGSPVGNISTEFVYLMKDGDDEHQATDTHAIDARLLLDDEEFGQFSGTYQNKGEGIIDAVFTMTRFPLSLANGFVPDQIVGLEGYGEGQMTIKGTARHPLVDGEVYVEDAYLVSQPYGVRMRFDDDPVRIVGSHLLLENFGLYAYNEEPLNLMGDIDFTDTEHITMDMRMRASNLLLINAKQEAKSIAFGKAFVNFFARLQGPLEQLSMRGKLDVLGSTDMTYMLLDSPLSTDNRLDELVKFTDFNDTTQTIVTRPMPSGLNADLTISVSQGAHIVCDLNVEQTNYIDLMGGGDLRMTYNSEGISLTGRYTLSSGEMKYSLPVIPLKTFTIKDGSYVEFTGDPMNPRLNITATERTKATVGDMSGTTRSVAFDCGVVITKTLNDMGLEFIIDAPEDNNISGELTTMSAEERGKIAVTMLTTGMYLAGGDTSGFSMNSALSSFLQSEINNIAGSALKTLDLSVGIDNTTDAAGTMHTDYSFKFAKRFMNNRLKIQIGGKVSSGSNDMGQNQSFFDNVTMEYRLNQDATKNVKMFYSQNVYDWLEGYTGEYGLGFVWRRQLDNFWDIFRFWKKEQQPMMMMRQPAAQRDSLRTDSVKANNVKSENKQQP